MIIYHESKAGYLAHVDDNSLKQRLSDSFRKLTGSVPADHYVWADEYSRFANALSKAEVANDIEVAIEYHISAAGRYRIDVLLAGSDDVGDNAVIIELKAWETAQALDIPEMVFSPVAGGSIKQHPCVQARKYKRQILRFNEDVVSSSISLFSAAYLFNLQRRTPEPLEDGRYADALNDSPLFLANDVVRLRQFLAKVVPRKPHGRVIHTIEHGRLRPSSELITRVSSMLDGNQEFELVDEQNVAFQVIRHTVAASDIDAGRHVFVIEGGPGTGKSVIAIQLLAELLRQERMAYFIAPNKAFRDTLIEFLARGNSGYREDGEALLRSSWSFHDVDYLHGQQNEVFIVDEAHRLKDEAYQYAGESMVEDMVRASRIAVFFIDETQRVAWNDSGSIAAIRAASQKFGAEFHQPFTLTAQYRCNGSSGYLNWLDDVLQIKSTGNYENWGDGQYDFRVFDRAEDLYAALKERNGGNKARLVAGYSWEWPTDTRKRGSSCKHVEADGLSLPWNFDGENWATSADGLDQVGCIHTSQGIEFDWLGVLIGPDLVVEGGQVLGVSNERAKNDASLKGWKKAFKEAKHDASAKAAVLDKVQMIIKSTYKVLLSRGRMGCYVWCADVELRDYLRARLALASGRKGSDS